MENIYVPFHKQLLQAFPSVSFKKLTSGSFFYRYRGTSFTVAHMDAIYHEVYNVEIEESKDRDLVQKNIEEIFQEECLFINTVLHAVPKRVEPLFRKCFENREEGLTLLGQPIRILNRLKYMPEFRISTLPLFQPHLGKWSRSLNNEGSDIIGFIRDDGCYFRRSATKYSMNPESNLCFLEPHQLSEFIAGIKNRYHMIVDMIDEIEERSQRNTHQKDTEVVTLPDDWFSGDEINVYLRFYTAKRAERIHCRDHPLVTIYPNDVVKTMKDMERIRERYREMLHEVRYLKRMEGVTSIRSS